MKHAPEDKRSSQNTKGPIFLPKGDGQGWALNFARPAILFWQ